MIRPPLIGAQIYTVLRSRPYAIPRQRASVPGAAPTVAAGQPAGAVDDPLPWNAVSTGVRNPSYLTRRTRPAGQPCDLTVRRDATFGDSANERVNAFDEQPPPANRANTTNGASRANKRRNKECAIGHVFPLFLAFAMFAG